MELKHLKLFEYYNRKYTNLEEIEDYFMELIDDGVLMFEKPKPGSYFMRLEGHSKKIYIIISLYIQSQYLKDNFDRIKFVLNRIGLESTFDQGVIFSVVQIKVPCTENLSNFCLENSVGPLFVERSSEDVIPIRTKRTIPVYTSYIEDISKRLIENDFSVTYTLKKSIYSPSSQSIVMDSSESDCKFLRDHFKEFNPDVSLSEDKHLLVKIK